MQAITYINNKFFFKHEKLVQSFFFDILLQNYNLAFPNYFVKIHYDNSTCRMSEESRPLTYFGSKGLIEGTMTSRSELLPDAEIPVVDLAVVLMLQVLLLTASTAGA